MEWCKESHAHKIVEITIDDQERNLLPSAPLQTQFFEASIKQFDCESRQLTLIKKNEKSS